MLKKYFLKPISLFVLLFSLSTNLFISKASAVELNSEEKLSEMTVGELVEYGESKGLEFDLPNYDLVDKNELINVINAMSEIPDEINLDESELIVNEKSSNGTASRGLTEGISPNHTQSKTYSTTLTGNYSCKINIYIRYDMYVDYVTGRKELYEVKSITSDSVTSPVSGATYTQIDGWVDRQSSNSAIIKGIGVYTWYLTGVPGAVTRQLNFNATFTM